MEERTSHNKALDDLERDAERDRAELAGTVEALRGRLGADGSGLSGMVSRQARGYVEDRRSAAIEGAWRRIEDHPLQAVALAAVVAYPVVRIVTKIPAPILLLGAGVALAGRGGPGKIDANQSDEFARITSAPIGGSGTTSLPENGFREPQVSTSANAPASAETTGIPSLEAETGGGQTGAEALPRMRERATEAGRAGGETVVAAIRRNPAIAGGISLAIGAALAAILPRTRVEGRAFGGAAEDVREQAQSLAAEGVEAGRRAVGAAIDAAADEAEEQNLTGEDARTAIREGANNVGAAIRDAADEAKDAIKGSTGPGSGGRSEGKSD